VKRSPTERCFHGERCGGDLAVDQVIVHFE
jgi:hypothetical protein